MALLINGFPKTLLDTTVEVSPNVTVVGWPCTVHWRWYMMQALMLGIHSCRPIPPTVMGSNCDSWKSKKDSTKSGLSYQMYGLYCRWPMLRPSPKFYRRLKKTELFLSPIINLMCGRDYVTWSLSGRCSPCSVAITIPTKKSYTLFIQTYFFIFILSICQM